MTLFARLAIALLAGVSILSGALALAEPATAPAAGAAQHYVCPPCGAPCDAAVFDKPGTCPKCGMVLVEQAKAAADAAARKKVGILIFNSVEIIDYTGPWEMFGDAGFDVYTVAETKDPVTTAMGMTVIPKYTFADAPQPDILLVPGGGVKGARESAATLKWVKDASARAERTMSVCNGAFILASAGLLDGLTATTTAGLIDRLKAEFPKIHVVDNQRFVDNGRVITAAGLTSGIDGALHVISVTLGHGEAQKVALDQEYDWRPGSGYARGALAERNIPRIDADAVGEWSMVRTEGGTDRWDIVFHGTSALSSAELMERLGREFATKGNWVQVKSGGAEGASDWKFRGRDGRDWTGLLKIRPDAGASRQYTVTLAIARVG
jgi:putative intracellular protease/amidase